MPASFLTLILILDFDRSFRAIKVQTGPESSSVKFKNKVKISGQECPLHLIKVNEATLKFVAIVEKRDRIGTTPRIWAVIIGDTTYGISLLTDTIHGSNFAIPSTQIHPAGTGRIFAVSGEESVVRKQCGVAPSQR